MPPPRLLVVVNVYKPDLGGGVLFADLCEALAARGVEVTVRCAYPYYPEWTDKTGRNGRRIDIQVERGVRVERFGIYIPSDPHALSQRLLYEASFPASLLRRVPHRGQFDAIMVFCPLVGAISYAAVARRLTGCPLWLNVQDLAAEAAAVSGIVRGRQAARLMVATQRWLFNRADVWSTISPVMEDRLRPLRSRHQPLLLLPNWLHRSLHEAIARESPDPTAPPGRPLRLLYSGNIGAKQDLLRICRVLQASDADFTFRIQGGGSRSAEVAAWANKTSDTRFSFYPLSDEAGLAHALAEADLFVIPEKEGAGGSFIPSKLIPAFSAGTPVMAICDADSPLGREMMVSEAGPRISWAGLHEVAALINVLPDQPERHLFWKRQALRRAQYYSRSRIIDLYEHTLRAVVAGRRPERSPGSTS